MSFDLTTRILVWKKGSPIAGIDPAEYRRDSFGRVINWRKHGQRNAVDGWEIDHITPKALGGTDALWNLQPLHCLSNARKSDSPVNIPAIPVLDVYAQREGQPWPTHYPPLPRAPLKELDALVRDLGRDRR